jgi:predicted glycoside hydrolase/deacetylase ChbG (UPF0249 family)
MAGKISLGEVERELDAQISKVLDYGIRVSHLDSHQHIHMLPGIRKVVGELAGKYSISAIRYPKESLRPYMLGEKGGMARLAQLICLNAFCTIARTSSIKQPGHFFGFFYGGRLTRDRLLKIFENLKPGSTNEVMCHPGLFDHASRYKHWNYRWLDELDALTDQEVRDYLDSRGVELVSYADI